MRTRASFVLVVVLASALPAAGCFRSHTIEPGTWKLTISPTESSGDAQSLVPPPRKVEVNVDWGREKAVEELKINYYPEAAPGEPPPKPWVLAGKVQEGKVEIVGFTSFWNLRLWGVVESSVRMNGNVFARGRLQDKRYFSGTFRLVKLQLKE
jgi:hypothetical protein